MAGSRMWVVEVYKSRLERTVKIQLASEVVRLANEKAYVLFFCLLAYVLFFVFWQNAL